MFQGLLGDAVLIWRVWIVWNKRWSIVIIPFKATVANFGNLFFSVSVSILAYLGPLVIGIIGTAANASNHLGSIVFIPTAALYVVSTGLNTGLIVGRLLLAPLSSANYRYLILPY